MKRYSVQKQAGEGAYGVVLKCYDKEENTYVAVKKFKGKEDDATIREVKLLRALKHPNIINMKDAFRVRGKLHLVFEFMDRNMLEVLQQHPRGIPEREVKEYVYQLCLAIHHCHRHGVMHRDIKPENLLVNADRTMRLCDFGVARALSKSGKHTDYVATRWYRAPELLVGRVDYSLPVDMFAIGCIMSEMLTGRPLFPGKSELDQLHILHRVMGELPSDLDAFMRQNARFRGKINFAADRAPGSNTSDLRRYRPLDQALRGYISDGGLAFMQRLLELDPARRLTSKEALRCSYFDDVRDPFDGRVREAKAARRRRDGGEGKDQGSTGRRHAPAAAAAAKDTSPHGASASSASRANAATAGSRALPLTAEQREALRRKKQQQQQQQQQQQPSHHSHSHSHKPHEPTGAATSSGAPYAAPADPGPSTLQRLPSLGAGTATAGTAASGVSGGGRAPRQHGQDAAAAPAPRYGHSGAGTGPIKHAGAAALNPFAAGAAYGRRSHAAAVAAPRLPTLRHDRPLGQPRTEDLGGKVSGLGAAPAPRMAATHTSVQAPHAAFGRRGGRRGPRRLAFDSGPSPPQSGGRGHGGGGGGTGRALPSLGHRAQGQPRRTGVDALDRLMVGGASAAAPPANAGHHHSRGHDNFGHPVAASRLPKLGDPGGAGWGGGVGRSAARQRLGRNVLGAR